jgi:hypothetical protein
VTTQVVIDAIEDEIDGIEKIVTMKLEEREGNLLVAVRDLSKATLDTGDKNIHQIY